MKRFVIQAALAAALLAGWAVAPVRAQNPAVRTIYNPYSPYLNLLRTGSPYGVAGNYYGLVRPQLDAQNAFQNLQRQINQNTGAITASGVDQSTGLPYTGHPAAFLNLSHYYSRGFTGGGSSPSAGGVGGAPRTGGGFGGGTGAYGGTGQTPQTPNIANQRPNVAPTAPR
jgi:hypothetical protein